MDKILITGATGNLGKSLINQLLKKVSAENIAVLIRNADRMEDFKKEGIEARVGDYTNYHSLVKAFKGIDKLFFISGSEFDGRTKQHENVVDAAKEAGIKHVFYTSFQRKNEDANSPISFVIADHILTENWLKASELTYTLLKHNLYMDMLPLFIGDKVLETGLIYQPAGEGEAAFTLRDDMAELAAHILTTNGHDNKTYDITSEQTYSYHDIAKLISEVTGQTITYQSPSVEAFNKTLTEAGVPAPYIGLFSGFSQAICQGELDHTNSIFEQMIGRKATSMKAYLMEVYS